MYTQCPECDSIFEITATDLAVAGGFVRCGQCAESFDALNSLSDNTESLPTAPAPSRAKAALDKTRPKKHSVKAKKNRPVATNTTEPDTDADDSGLSEALNDESEEIQHDIDSEPVEPDLDSESEIVVEIGDEPGTNAEPDETDTTADDETETATDDSETADQADTLPEDSQPETAVSAEPFDDDEILLDESYQPPMEADDEAFYDDDDDDFEDTLVAVDESDQDAEDEDEPIFEDFLDDEPADDPQVSDSADTEDAPETAKANEAALFSLPLPELTTLDHPGRGELPEKLEGGEAACDPSAQSRKQPDAPIESAAQISETATTAAQAKANDAYDAEDARDLKDYLNAPVNRAASAAWIGGSVLMVLLLLGQFVHRNRGDLVIHPRLGPPVSSIYERLGIDLQPNWQINDYKVVGQARLFLMPVDDTDDETAEDATAIRFVALITNGASLPQPAPMVRLTLRDRWGDATGMRDFTPPEYLPDRAMIGQMLEPGQRLRVVLNMHDLGGDAVGFDFDMCLPDAAGTLRCANEDSI